MSGAQTIEITPGVTPGVADPSTPPVNEFLTTLPEEYRAKPYLKDVTDMSGILKQLDGAQASLGAPKLPKSDAPQEEWDKVHTLMGKPEASTGYEISKEGDTESAKKINDGLQDMFHKAGLSKKQSDSIVEGYRAIAGETLEASATAKAERSKLFTETSDKIFGESKDQALAVSEKLIGKFAPESIRTQMETLGPEQKVAVAAVLKGISDKYISSDDITAIVGGTASVSGRSLETVTAELRAAITVMNSTGALDAPGRAAAQSKVTTLSLEKSKLKK